MHELLHTVRELSTSPVLVLGDLILDRYIEGHASRVSPEAPVLVFEKQSERYLLGGACNVAANLVALGAQTSILGVIGADMAGEQLKALLEEGGIDVSALVVDESRPTTRKTRYVSKTSQVLRVDSEKRHSVAGEVKQAILACLAVRPFPYKAILLSDYGKGVLTRELIEAAVEAAHSTGGLVVVDPKGVDYERFRGVDLLTPNREEAEAATGIKAPGLAELKLVAARLRELTGIERATITLGSEGVFFEDQPGEARIIPTEAKAVFDVTGAGDTVIAMLTLALTSGVSLVDSLRLANVAAGIVVARFGTWAVSKQEILSVLGQQTNGKTLDLQEAISIAARMRTEGRRLVFTNGCFDILHPGHTDYLARARSYGDALMVAINSDASVRRQKKGEDRPINPLEDRIDVLSGLQAVDFVLPFDADTPGELIEAITPEVLVKGEDWRERGVVGQDWVESHGGQVVLVPLRSGCSTSAIIDRIRGKKG